MKKELIKNIRTACFCHPVESENTYYSCATAIYNPTDFNSEVAFELGKSIYIPIVKITKEKQAQGILPTDRLSANDVEKYIGECPKTIKYQLIVISGASYIESLQVKQYNESDLSDQDICLYNPVHADPETKNSTLFKSLVLELKTKKTQTIDCNLHVLVVLYNDKGHHAIVPICTDVCLNKNTVVKGTIARYNNAYKYLSDYYDYMIKFQITPTKKQLKTDDSHKYQYLWQIVFDIRLKLLERHLTTYKSQKPTELTLSKKTIYEYTHTIPQLGINFNDTYNKLVEDIKQSVKSQNYAKALIDLDQINDTLTQLNKNTDNNCKQLCKFSIKTEADYDFLNGFEIFLEAYLNLLIQINKGTIKGEKTVFIQQVVPIFNALIQLLNRHKKINDKLCEVLLDNGDLIVSLLYDLLHNDANTFRDDALQLVEDILTDYNCSNTLIVTISAFVAAYIYDIFHGLHNFIETVTGTAYNEIEPCLKNYKQAQYNANLAKAGNITFTDLWTKTQIMINQVMTDSTNVKNAITEKDSVKIDNTLQILTKDWSTLVESYLKGICLND